MNAYIYECIKFSHKEQSNKITYRKWIGLDITMLKEIRHTKKCKCKF